MVYYESYGMKVNMLQINERRIRHFLRRVRRLLPCTRKVRRKIMIDVEGGLREYVARSPNADMETITARFGSPEEIAAASVENFGTAEILLALRLRRSIMRILLLVCFLICGVLAYACYIWNIVPSYREETIYDSEQIESEQNYSIIIWGNK